MSLVVTEGERTTARGVWREAWSFVRRYPLVTVLPALFLATLAEALTLVGKSQVINETLSNLAVAFVYFLYIAYAETLVERVRSGAGVPPLGGLRELVPIASVATRMLGASFLVLGLTVAAVVVVALAASMAGAGDVLILLAIAAILPPLFFVQTRLSLFAPALSSEGLGPLAALRRSSELARGRFWLVFWTATLAFILEGLADELLQPLWEPLGPYGEWVGGSIASGVVMPLAAIATSLAYYRILLLEDRPSRRPPKLGSLA